jgi:hypothetical protein
MTDAGGGMNCQWDAWYNLMPGADAEILHVVGEVEVPSSSIALRLEPTNEGIVDDPTLIALKLVVERPEAGDDMMAKKEVSWEDRAPGIKRVRIDGPCPDMVEVRDIH